MLDVQIGGNHYKKYTIQPVELFETTGMSYLEANTLKYCLRYEDKNGIEDLNKASHCVKLLKLMNKVTLPEFAADARQKAIYSKFEEFKTHNEKLLKEFQNNILDSMFLYIANRKLSTLNSIEILISHQITNLNVDK